MCDRNFNIKIMVLATHNTAILVLIMIFCSLVQSSSRLHAKTDVAEKIANLNVFLF